MQKFAIELSLQKVAEDRRKWTLARREFDAGLTYVMNRLLHEALANYMSARDIAKHSGLPMKRVLSMMHERGLKTSMGKRVLAESAAKALATNSELLGIEPHEMDLMSPLAYLPMGSEMKRFLETQTVSGVADLPEDGIEQLVAKLDDAGIEREHAIQWVNEVVREGRTLPEEAHNRSLPASDSL